MSKLIGRKSVDINIRDLNDNHIPIYDKERGLWNTVTTSSIIDVNNFISSSEQVIAAIDGNPITPSSVTTNAVSVNTTIISSSTKTGIFNSTEIFDPPLPVDSFSGTLVEYVVQRENAVRTGTLYASWSGSSITYTDVSNADVGDTSDLSFNFIRSGDDVLLRVYSLGTGTGTWAVQVLFKMFPNLL